MKKQILVTLAVSTMIVAFGCGKDAQKSDQAGAEYFAQFQTASNGIPMSEDLQISGGTTTQSGFYNYYNQTTANDIRLRLDTDGTFFLYRKPVSNYFLSQTDADNFRFNGLVGNYKVEGMRLVLENVGSTQDYNVAQNNINNGYYSNNVTTYEYSNKCFTLEIKSTIKLDTNISYDNGVRQETDALTNGQVVKFCRQ